MDTAVGQECFVSGAVSIWGISPLPSHHHQLQSSKSSWGRTSLNRVRLLNSSTTTLRVQQHGKRGGGGDGDNGQWQHQQQAAKHQPPDHLPHTSSYCGQTGQHWKLGGAPVPHPSTLPDAPSWIKPTWIGLPWIKQSCIKPPWIGLPWIKQSGIELSWIGQLRSAAASNPYTSLSRRP